MKNAFSILSWVFAAYFFVCFHLNAGFPPKEMNNTAWTMLLMFIFFFLVPFARNLKLGSVFEFAAKVEQIKDEVEDFRSEVRTHISNQNALFSSVSQSMNQHVNLTLPSLTEAREAEEQLPKLQNGQNGPDIAAQYIEQTAGDRNIALMKLRRELENELRRTLGKRLEYSPNRRSRLLGLRNLWNMFAGDDPERQRMESSLLYVLDVCNAAAHGQDVPEGHAYEAVFMGLRILDYLRHQPDG